MAKLNYTGAWSAAPTPFTKQLKIDKTSLKRMIDHHIQLGQSGIFLGGTCGEGPFIRREDFRELTSSAAKYCDGKIILAVQVTDNSYAKVIDNIKAAKDDGAQVAVIAEPWFCGCMREDDLLKYYTESIAKSVLPVCIYSRGAKEIPIAFYKQILNEPKVCMFKDSSCNEQMMEIALKARENRKALTLLTGYELGIPPYLKARYDSVLAGGGVLIGAVVVKMIEAAKDGRFDEVEKLQKKCEQIFYPAYGGKDIKSWLTGLKYALVKMGIFKTTAGYLNYPLTDATKKRIDKMIEKNKDLLFNKS